MKKSKNKNGAAKTSKTFFLDAQRDAWNRVHNVRIDIETIESSNGYQKDRFEKVLSALFIARVELLHVDFLIFAELTNGRMGPNVSQVHKDFGERVWKEIDALIIRIQSKLIAMSFDFKDASVLWESAWEIAKSHRPEISTLFDVTKKPHFWITDGSWNLMSSDNEA